MLSLGFSLALVVGVVVALVVLVIGMPVVSLDRWNEGLHDAGGDDGDGSSLFDFSSSDYGDSSSDGSTGD